MKEFENWWREYWLTNNCRGDKDRALAKLAWETALGQVLAKIDPYESDAENFRAIYDFIRWEELEELEQ